MNNLQSYVTSPLVSLSRFDHPACEPHSDPPEECSPCYSINFIERGSYTLQVGRRRWQMSPGTLFITWPGMLYRCEHGEEFPSDVSLLVMYTDAFASELAEAVRLKPGRLAHVAALDNRLAYLYQRLKRLSTGEGEAMTAETLAGELFASVAGREEGAPRRLHKSHQLAWYVERVEAARALMETEYQASHSLASLARRAGMSPFHFARIFQELAGTPPHRYLVKVRLAQAAERLRDGAGVTQTCFSTGFTNLSHFIRLFRRTYGLTPSQFARRSSQGQ
ncbi:MAG TPA: AraC family transcriptional regulator [Pyrinomonadaceae bacterium]|jgi:AraC-like DNA-binding protein